MTPREAMQIAAARLSFARRYQAEGTAGQVARATAVAQACVRRPQVMATLTIAQPDVWFAVVGCPASPPCDADTSPAPRESA